MRCKENGFTEYKSTTNGSNFHDNRRLIDAYYQKFENSKTYPCSRRSLQVFLTDENDTSCDQISYAVGYRMGDKVIILLELCYNASDKRVNFIHFVLSHHTHPISEKYNPVNVSGSNHGNLPADGYFEKFVFIDRVQIQVN